ncbi:MAG: GNAT family N-acetyltransferase [Ekhidna sp.]|uniref:GNAT family N-acetyltransferase n=1 Tax=Ekhidna sp. TaxID=2608089 RepID=UPI0032F01E5C
MESSIKGLVFTERTSESARFFHILPEDWQEGIAPYWKDYKGSSRIFTLEHDGHIIGGGITFLKPAPDTLAYEKISIELFREGRIYFGFLWLSPQFRGNDLGSYWVNNLRLKFPNKKFWLSIEDKGLSGFYQKNGFTISKEIEVNGSTEWIMID